MLLPKKKQETSFKSSTLTVGRKTIMSTAILRKKRVKKLVAVLATFTLVTVARKKVVKDGENLRSILVWVLCIRYPINFRKKSVSVLFDPDNEVNAVHPIFAKKLSLPIRPMDIGAQKINSITLNTYEIVVAAFLVTNKANQIRFFKEIFLMANVSLEVVFGILFFTLNSADVDFLDWKLWWRTYTTKKALPTIRRVKLVDKKEFAAATLEPEHETYVVHVGLVSFIILSSSIALPNSSPLELDV